MAFDPDAYLSKKQPREEAAPASSGGFNPDAYIKKLGIEAPTPAPGFFQRLFSSKPVAPAVPTEGGELVSPEEIATPIAEPAAAPVAAEPPPYKSRLEALDDAVNLLEEGYGLDKVVGAFSNLGISKDEIAAHGVKRRSEYFAPQKIQAAEPTPVEPGRPAGEMRGMDTTLYEDITGIGKRSAARGRQAIAGLLKEAGVYDEDELARITANEERKIQAARPSMSVQDGMENIGNAKTMSEAAYQLAANPAATFTMLAESLLMTAPSLAAIVTGGGIPMGAAIGTYSGSLEYGSSLAETLANNNIDPMNAYAVGRALRDPKFIEELRERGLKRGLTIGAIDGLTAGFAGKFIAPVMREISAGKLAGQQARNATIGAWAKETGMQVAGGGGGEALAQALTGEYKPSEILLEAVAEGITAPFEARGAVREARKLQTGAPPVPTAPPTVTPPAPPAAAPEARIEPTLAPVPAKAAPAPAAPAIDPQTQQDLIDKANQDFNGKIVTTTNYQTADDIEINLGKDARDVYFNELKRLEGEVFEKRGIKPTEEAKPAEIPFRNDNQKRVVEAVMRNFNLTPEQVTGYINEGRIKLGKDGKMTAQSVEQLRVIGQIDRDSAALKETLKPEPPKITPEIQTREIYRVGEPYQESGFMDPNLTAQDIVSYEQDQLKNQGVVPLPGIDLSQIPASKTRWVTFDKKSARQYVNMEAEPEFRDKIEKKKETFRIIATDPYGGYLIETNPVETKPEIGYEPLPRTPEEEERDVEIGRLQQDIERLGELTPKNSLYFFFKKNQLDPKEMLDVSPDKTFNFLRKKGGAFVSDFVSTGQLNDWLPFEMRVYGTEDSVELGDKESAGTEYIKDMLRNREYLPYETKVELENLGKTLQDLEAEVIQGEQIEKVRDEIADIIEREGTADIESIIAGVPEARAGEPAAAPEQPFALTQETEAERALREAQEAETRETREAQAIADRERELFTLTPETPEIETPPTGDMFGARGLTEQPARAAPVAPPAEGLFAPAQFTIAKDGIDGTEISADQVPNGNDAFQYAVGRVEPGGPEAIFRRSAQERGTYGGWRYENNAFNLKQTAVSQTEPVNADPATERVDRNTGIQQPPILETPEGYKARKGRQDQVVLAARLLAEGKITKTQYDDYVDYYMPVAEVSLEQIEPALTDQELLDLLNRPAVKANKNPKLFNAAIPKGTKVGMRMDIPALEEGKRTGVNGSIVSVHTESPPSKPRAGNNLSYTSTGAVRNAVMAIRKEEEAIKVAENIPGREGTKKPQQTVEGEWLALTPEEVTQRVIENFDNPEWVQVGFDPLRHSFFYSRRDMRPIVAADEVLQIGRFVLAKNPTYAPREQFFYDITQASQNSEYNQEKLPSFTRQFERLNKAYLRGVYSADEVIDILDRRRKELTDARFEKYVAGERKRGPDFVRQKLLEAKRRGDLLDDAVDLAEWFIQQNPLLVADLGISVRRPPEFQRGVAGSYNPINRVITLIKGTLKVDAPIHEILHHLERMMPEPVRRAIQQSWLRSFLRSQKEAFESGDQNLINYYALLNDYHFGKGQFENLQVASELIEDGKVAYEHYQNFNPSEFWAVNASRIMQGRFDARDAVLARLKQWLSELVQKIRSLFGARSDASIIRALDSLAKSDGKFVSSAMLGEGGVYNSVVRKNIFGGPTPNPTWGRPDDSKADDAIFVLQDKMIDTKRVIEEIEKAVGNIQERWDAYLQEELYHGRTAKQTNNFLNDELVPLLKDMQQRGISLVELEEFLHNNTAEERNVQVAKVNPNMPDGGSGILTADAQKYLAGLSSQRKKDLQELANKVYKIIENTQDLLVSSGLETQQTINAWRKAYKNYVPLMREEGDYETANIGRGVGQGFSVKGPSSKRATGSARNVIDILANVAIQREKAIVRAEKTRVSQAVYGLAVQYPNTEFWLAIDPKAITSPKQAVTDLVAMGLNPADAANIIAEPVSRTIDPVTNQVVERINPILRTADNVLAVRINGADKFVFFNTQDPRALRMVQALKNLDADQLSRGMSIIGRITRYFASVNTQYNPIFGIINFTRDVQGALLNLTTTPIADKAKQIYADTLPALRGIYADIRSRRKGLGAKTGTWAQLWEEFQREGGQTGFRDQFSRSEERAEALAKTLAQLSEGRLKRSARVIFDWLSDYNETLENAVRLAAYKAAKDKGISNAQAASIAKNLTVNFNRKGQIGRQMGALYAFFNASTQGTYRMYKTLTGPAGKKIMYGGLLLGSAQALLLAAAGFDEDQPSDFVKEKNLVIPLFDKGKYVNIPMPLGFNVIPNTGRVLTEWALSGFKNTSKRVVQITGAVLDAFNPIGNAGWSMQTFAPTVADPAVALFENKDWTGKPIAKKDISSLDPTPGYTRAKDTASWFSKQLSYLLNLATGGTKYQPGIVSPTPDQIDYLIGQATGGVGREVMKVEQTITSSITGEELPSYKIPLAGRFYGSVQEASGVREKFYNNIQMLNQHENELRGRQKNREDVQSYIQEHPEALLFKQANNIERDIQKLRKYKEELKKRGASKEEIKRIEDQMTDRMKALNDRVQSIRP